MKLFAKNIICNKLVEVEFVDHYDNDKVEVKYKNHMYVVNRNDMLIYQ